MKDEDALTALSPLDGRYAFQTAPLQAFFSEFAYIKYRVLVETRYIMMLSKWKIIRPLTKKETQVLQSMGTTFSLSDAKRVKMYEKQTKHDMKAIEYMLRDTFKATSLRDVSAFLHFGLTSDDVNNLAYGMMLAESKKAVILPSLQKLLAITKKIASGNAGSVMLARTHGQPAVPTTFGKEISVYYSRLKKLEHKTRVFRFEGKLNGAVGNYNALTFAYPKTNWVRFSREFISSLGLTPNFISTQILPADNFVEYALILYQINTILIGFCQDMWMYISRGVVKLTKDRGQVGSSTMPQKINPILFENAEGNLQVASSMFELFARKLPVSRMQRDLSDSTVKRSIGSALAYTVLAWGSIDAGLGKISFDKKMATGELHAHWEVLAEAMQIYFKLQGDGKGYEKVKDMLMGSELDEKTYVSLVHAYPPLAKLTPSTYIGLARKLTTLALKKT